MTLTEQIHSAARDLLQTGTVDCVIGYEEGPRGRVRPAFIIDAEKVGALAWDQRCTHNLTVYLSDHLGDEEDPRRVAILAKPCDTRAIQVLQAEGRIDRERVHVIGVACDGILQGAGYGKGEHNQLQERCMRCDQRTPLTADTCIGEARSVEVQERTDLQAMEALSLEERTQYWLGQFDRCIRCYACRQVCPMCDCPTCMFERDDSLWVGMGSGIAEKRTFHLGRAFHLAGRCIGCDECQRVCPMDIPVGLLNRKLAAVMEDFFDFQPGMEPLPSPLTTIVEEQALAVAERGYGRRTGEDGPQ